MSSFAQKVANIVNAQKSTGPKTPEGLAASKFNALKHGLSGRQVVIKGEDPEQYDRDRGAFFDFYNPAGAVEEMLVEQIAQTWWKMQRAIRVEAALINELGELDIFADEKAMKKYSLFLRHRNALDRSWRHALHELDKLQRARVKAALQSLQQEDAAPTNEIGSVLQWLPTSRPALPDAPPITYPMEKAGPVFAGPALKLDAINGS